MAQKVVLTLTDDFDGSEAAETVSFSLDGISYEVELNAANADELRNTLAPNRSAGRRLSGTRAVKQPRPSAASQDVRQWGLERVSRSTPAAASATRSFSSMWLRRAEACSVPVTLVGKYGSHPPSGCRTSSSGFHIGGAPATKMKSPRMDPTSVAGSP